MVEMLTRYLRGDGWTVDACSRAAEAKSPSLESIQIDDVWNQSKSGTLHREC